MKLDLPCGGEREGWKQILSQNIRQIFQISSSLHTLIWGVKEKKGNTPRRFFVAHRLQPPPPPAFPPLLRATSSSATSSSTFYWVSHKKSTEPFCDPIIWSKVISNKIYSVPFDKQKIQCNSSYSIVQQQCSKSCSITGFGLLFYGTPNKFGPIPYQDKYSLFSPAVPEACYPSLFPNGSGT